MRAVTERDSSLVLEHFGVDDVGTFASLAVDQLDHVGDSNTSVIVHAMDGYVCGFSFGLGGILLTKDQRFCSFELEMNPALTEAFPLAGA